MGIYDSNPLALPQDSGGKALLVVAAVAVIVIAYFAGGFLVEAFKPNAVDAWFDRSTILSSEQTFLHVKVTNVTGADAENIFVRVEAKDSSKINLEAVQASYLSKLPANDFRTMDFLVNPVGSVLPGRYAVQASATINGEKFVRDLTIEIAPQ